MPNYRPILHPTTGKPLLNESNIPKIYDADLYPDGPPEGCCCDPGGCCPSAPETLTANITISCDCVTGVSVTLTYQAVESALAGFDIWRGSTSVGCTGPGGSTLDVKFILLQDGTLPTCAGLAFTCGDADDEATTNSGAENVVCNPFFAEGMATGIGLGAPFYCCENNDEESFIEWTVTE